MDNILEMLEVQAEALESAIDGNPDALAAWDSFLNGVVATVDTVAKKETVTPGQIYLVVEG